MADLLILKPLLCTILILVFIIVEHTRTRSTACPRLVAARSIALVPPTSLHSYVVPTEPLSVARLSARAWSSVLPCVRGPCPNQSPPMSHRSISLHPPRSRRSSTPQRRNSDIKNSIYSPTFYYCNYLIWNSHKKNTISVLLVFLKIIVCYSIVANFECQKVYFFFRCVFVCVQIEHLYSCCKNITISFSLKKNMLVKM